MKNIIILGGGTDQIDLILGLKKRGYHTILIDYNDNPKAKEYADLHIQESTLDIENVLEITRKYNAERIVTACTDQALLTMAYVSEELSLPCYITYQQALNLTNKKYMKQVMKDNNIPTSDFRIVTSKYDDISELKFPLIVKPADCNSSKGVRKVNDITEYPPLVEQALSLSRTSTAIVEEFKEGKEVSVDCYVTEKGIVVLSIGELIKAKIDEATYLIVQNIIPAQITDNAVKSIHNIAKLIAQSFHLTNTPILIQAIVNDDAVNVIEFSARLGGGCKHHTIKEVTGFDVMDANIDSLLGITPAINTVKQTGIISRIHLYLNEGTFTKCENIDNLISSKEVIEFILNKQTNTRFTSPKASTDRLGSILLKAPDINTLNNKISKILQSLQILDSTGKEMLDKRIYKNFDI